jgi:polysaccharide biosynthesis/export protein
VSYRPLRPAFHPVAPTAEDREKCANVTMLRSPFDTPAFVRRRRFLCRSLPALAALALGGCAGSTDPPAPLTAPPADAEAAYRIGPGDTLSIYVDGAPDLGVKSLPVRPDGRISIPLVPDIRAVGETPSALGTEIAARLKKYVKDPNVTVMVDTFNGPLNRAIRVIGQATAPATIPYVDRMTLLDVMIAVKGLTPFAAGNSARIIRRVDGKETSIPVKIGALLNRGNMSQNVAMHPGDVVVIPESWF